MALSRTIRLQQRADVFAYALIRSCALSVIARVDGDAGESPIGQRPEQPELLLLLGARTMQHDDNRPPAGRRGWRHQNAGHALALF